jgi:mevalonate kinase
VTEPARGRAGGKVILLGEHAVVYGRPALAAGLARGVVAEVQRGAGPVLVSDRPELAADGRPARAVAQAATLLGLDPTTVVVTVRSELPAGAGLGSSAALVVAVLRALAAAAGRQLTLADELTLGRRLEAIFHGHPSGVDPAAAALGPVCFRFVRGEPPAVTRLTLAAPLPLVLGFGDRPRSTAAAVGGLRARWAAEPARHERLFDEIAAIVETGLRAAETGDLAALGRALDANQAVLAALGVSSAETEVLIAAARRAGALGAKLTGGGGGGAVVAVAPEPARVAAALSGAGARTLAVTVGPRGEEAAA